MNEIEYLAAIAPAGIEQEFSYVKVDSPAAKFKGLVTLTREVAFVGVTGVDYAERTGREPQARTWGTRRDAYFVDHTPKSGPRKGQPTVYATIFATAGSFRTTYFVDGEEATRERYNSYRTPSAANGSLDDSGYMDICLADLAVGAVLAAA